MENVDTLIISRLGERQRKMDFISGNLKKRQTAGFPRRRIVYTLASIAACIVAVFIVSPWSGEGDPYSDMTVPSFEECRGDGFEEIESLIKEGCYAGALPLVDAELERIAEAMGDVTSAEMNEDEKAYTLALYDTNREELLWCKIYLLAKAGKEDELESCCKNYLGNSAFRIHRDEVEEILKKDR